MIALVIDSAAARRRKQHESNTSANDDSAFALLSYFTPTFSFSHSQSYSHWPIASTSTIQYRMKVSVHGHCALKSGGYDVLHFTTELAFVFEEN